MCLKDRLDTVEIRFREWCQPKVDRLTWRELDEFRVICDELSIIRRGFEHDKHQ